MFFFGKKHFKSGEIDLYPIYVSILLVGMTSKGNVPSLHVFLQLSRAPLYNIVFSMSESRRVGKRPRGWPR